jgi:hypothetical protein
VSLRKHIFSDLGYGSQNGYLAIPLYGVSDNRLVAGTGDAVEYDPGDVNTPIKMDTTRDHRRHGSCTFGAIDNQNDGGVKKFCEFRRAGAAFYVQAVIEAAITFDDSNVFGFRVNCE